MDALIAAGHREKRIWKMTPLNMHAWLELWLSRRERERKEDLYLHATAARSDEKTINKLLR